VHRFGAERKASPARRIGLGLVMGDKNVTLDAPPGNRINFQKREELEQAVDNGALFDLPRGPACSTRAQGVPATETALTVSFRMRACLVSAMNCVRSANATF
jgi:hypothetical protein